MFSYSSTATKHLLLDLNKQQIVGGCSLGGRAHETHTRFLGNTSKM